MRQWERFNPTWIMIVFFEQIIYKNVYINSFSNYLILFQLFWQRELCYEIVSCKWKSEVRAISASVHTHNAQTMGTHY